MKSRGELELEFIKAELRRLASTYRFFMPSLLTKLEAVSPKLARLLKSYLAEKV